MRHPPASSLHGLSSDTDSRGCSDPAFPPPGTPQGRDNIYRRLENSLIGDLIGGVALFVILIAGLWIGAGLS